MFGEDGGDVWRGWGRCVVRIGDMCNEDGEICGEDGGDV